MQNTDILALAGLRLDGRRPGEIRSIKHNMACVPTADGSAYLEQGFNKVIVMVHGPQEPKKKLMDHNGDRCNVVVRISHLPFSGAEWKQRRNVSGQRFNHNTSMNI
jgi:exosome complex component RRP41